MARRKNTNPCKFENCGRTDRGAHGWCKFHYQQHWNGIPKTLNPGYSKPKGPKPGSKGFFITKIGGYKKIRVYEDGFCRWILEHRYVMEKEIGRRLKTTEQVHHRDGNRLNNDISNLELWITKRQPAGVRLEDALADAQSLIDKYGDCHYLLY